MGNTTMQQEPKIDMKNKLSTFYTTDEILMAPDNKASGMGEENCVTSICVDAIRYDENFKTLTLQQRRQKVIECKESSRVVGKLLYDILQ